MRVSGIACGAGTAAALAVATAEAGDVPCGVDFENSGEMGCSRCSSSARGRQGRCRGARLQVRGPCSNSAISGDTDDVPLRALRQP